MSENLREAADDGAVLRSIAKSIRPAFPNAADLLLGIERMHWPSEAHRLNAENAHLRSELDRLRAEVAEARQIAAVNAGLYRSAEAERDVLRARLAKVGEVLTEWGALSTDGDFAEAIQESGAWRFVRDLRAALASVPEPSDSGFDGPTEDVEQRLDALAEQTGKPWREPSDSEPAPDADRCRECGVVGGRVMNTQPRGHAMPLEPPNKPLHAASEALNAPPASPRPSGTSSGPESRGTGRGGERRWSSSGHSWCPGCHLSIKPGDEVTYDAEDRVVHVADLKDGAP